MPTEPGDENLIFQHVNALWIVPADDDQIVGRLVSAHAALEAESIAPTD